MQRQIEAMRQSMEAQEFSVSSGGGAVQVKINGAGQFLSLRLDPEFLKEDSKVVEETILNAVREAATTAKDRSEAEMQKISAGFQVPGMF